METAEPSMVKWWQLLTLGTPCQQRQGFNLDRVSESVNSGIERDKM